MRVSRLVLPIMLVCLSGTALAQSSRLYFAGYMGLNIYSEKDFTETENALRGEMEYKNALSFAGAMGLRLDRRWRLEGEYSYRSTNLDGMDIEGVGGFELGGELNTTLLMLNLYRDFNVSFRNMEPFVTAGVGLVRHSGEIDDMSGLAVDATDDSIGAAWQVGGGLRYRIDSDSVLTMGYRWLGTTDAEFDSYEFGWGGNEVRLGLEYDIPVDFFKFK